MRSINRKNLAKEILKILDDKITIEKNEQVNPYIYTMDKDSIDIAREMDKLREMTNE